MFLILFTISLVLISIYAIYKKEFHLVFFPCMLFLPAYYGFEISGSLPLITVTRIMFVVFYIYVFVQYRHNIKTIDKKKVTKSPVFWMFAGYFVLRIISNLYYVGTYSQPVKTIFSLIFEQAMLLVAACIMRFDEEQITKLIKVIVYVSVVMFILGIFESLTGIRIADQLYTVNRYMLNDHYIRLGLLRATVTLGLPGFYGNFCVLILPAILYLYEKERYKRYLVFIALDVFACIHSGARSSLFFIIAVLGMTFIAYIKDAKRIILYIKNAVIVVACCLAVISVLTVCNNRLAYYYTGSGKAMLNAIGFDFDLNAGAPSGVGGYGSNQDGVMSRTAQFSGIKYALSVNPLFGLGSGAQNRKQVAYYWSGSWRYFKTYDVGYVEIMCDEGIIGAISFIVLCSCIVFITKKMHEKSVIIFSCIWLLSYLICLLSTANVYYILFVYIITLWFKTISHTNAT